MKLIDKALEGKDKLLLYNYTAMDIIKLMCPFELGLCDLDCKGEKGCSGLEACRQCWNREYTGS